MANFTIEELPGLIHKKRYKSWGKKIFDDNYLKLSHDRKILLETQEQTRLIRKISNNILFFFCLTIISLVSYIYSISLF